VPLIGEDIVRVPPGAYHLSTVVGLDQAGGFKHGFAVAIEPEVAVTGDTTVTLDGRRAVRVEPSIQGRQTTRQDAVVEYARTFANPSSDGPGLIAHFGFGSLPLAITPTRQVTIGRFTAPTKWLRFLPT